MIPPRTSESGNVFLIIMMGIALFAALMFTFARGAQEGTGNLSRKKAEIIATDIITYAQRAERGVNRLLSKSVSENDISFENGIEAGYTNAGCAADSCKVFAPSGGAISWANPPEDANDGSAWIFTGANYVKGLGAAADATDAELLLILPNVNQTVCTQINKKLGISGIPQENADSLTTKFTGTFAAAPELIEENNGGTALDEVRTACFEGENTPAAGTYHFYHVLLQRP